MGKKLLIGIGIIILLLGIGAYLILKPAGIDDAILYVESGTVEVDTGNGWQSATGEMLLSKGDSVRTKEGTATIAFLEGEIMHLEPNTEVNIELITSSKITTSQKTGETWNKVTKLSGIGEFEVKTPNTVATVRGTTFFLNLSHLSVTNGRVGYGPLNNPGQIQVGPMQRGAAGTWQISSIPPADLARFNSFNQMTVNTLKRLRDHEIRKHSTILKQAEKRGYDWNKIQSELRSIDADSKPIEDKIYADLPSIFRKKAERAYKLTKEIKKAMNSKLTPTQTNNCQNPGKCRIWAKCDQRVDMLMVDGEPSGCISADEAVSQGLDYCGHYTLAQGNKKCNYQDKQIQHLCICP